jgi:hypothetical protein
LIDEYLTVWYFVASKISAGQSKKEWIQTAMVYRDLAAQPQAQTDFDGFLEELNLELTTGRRDPYDVVRDTLYSIYFGPALIGSPRDRINLDLTNLPAAARAVAHTFDARNTTTEPEYYSDIDPRLYNERKPYIWLWQMFDRSPLGQNALLGHRLRRMLAPLIFRRVGENFKCWSFVEWSFGYNLTFGDNVVGAVSKLETMFPFPITSMSILILTTSMTSRR